MYFSILALSQFAKSVLETRSSASVHSVYRKTINLAFGTSLLSLQAAGTVLSPVSLITSLSEGEMGMLPVHPGDSVSISGQTIEIHAGTPDYVFFHINPESCQIRDLSFAPELSRAQLSALTLMMRAVLEKSASGGFDTLFSSAPESKNSPVLSAAKCRLRETADAWKKAEWTKAAKALCTMTGLGPGLTPSGDDFLCGVFAGILLEQLEGHPFEEALREEISFHLQDTNDISRTFLSCALSGQFSDPVVRLPQAESAACILDAFSKIGHSSGMDTLAGIYFFLTQAYLLQK